MAPWIPNLIGLLGVVALAIPAIAADRLAARLSRIHKAARHEGTDEFLKELRDEVRSEMPVNSWRPFHRLCLYGGYAAVLLSALLRMVPAEAG